MRLEEYRKKMWLPQEDFRKKMRLEDYI